MLGNTLLNKILKTALSQGADFAEIFIEESFNSMIHLYSSKIQKSIVGKEIGAGIRVFYGKTAIYAFSNDLSETSLINAANAVAKASSNQTITKTIDLTEKKVANIHTYHKFPGQTEKGSKIEFMLKIDKAARAEGKRITQVDINLMEKNQKIFIANSEGLLTSDLRNYARVSVNTIAFSGTEKQTSSSNPGALAGYEFIEGLDPNELGSETAKSALKMLEADYSPSGKFPVIIDNGFGGVIFHEACGHGLETTSVAKGASIFSDKLGKEIAHPKVTAIDDGTLVNKWGSTNIDDEGTPTQKTVLIEKGVLKSFMVDKLGSIRTGYSPTGSGRRQSYRFAPTSRMRNTFIASGNDKFTDMVASIVYGIYAKKMGGGSVETGTGKFNFAVAEGYLIENGKITKPVRGASLIGNGADILKRISMVSDNLELAEGVCGSASGSVPTCVGQPAIKVDEIIVGGRKEI